MGSPLRLFFARAPIETLAPELVAALPEASHQASDQDGDSAHPGNGR
jgi:hypothetical protein